MAPQRTQNFNSIRLTTSNNSENNIILQEISGQLYINDHLVVTSNNIASLTKVTTIESNVTTLQSDVTTIESDVTTLQSDVTAIESDVTTLQSDVTAIESDVTTLQTDVQSLQSIFNISTRDTEANIIASTPTNPSGEVTVAYGTDTGDFYIYYGSGWYIYKDDTFANTYSLSFDGTNDYLDLSSLNSTISSIGTGAVTISMWVKFDSIGGVLAGHQSNNNGGYIFWVSDSNTIYASTTGGYGNISNAGLVTDQWVLLTNVRTGTSASLYKNSIVLGSFTMGSADNILSSIGSYSGGGYRLNGQIGLMQVYNRALSAAEIKQNYNATRGRFQ